MDRLYGFGESGNAYKVALMLTLCDLPWQIVPVDFFNGATRAPAFRADLNDMGEVPVLEHQGERLTQSGAILHRLGRETGKFWPQASADQDECWRWILFDNHKFTANLATYRFLRCFAPKPVNEAVLTFMRARTKAACSVAEAHLGTRDFMVGHVPTIADLSMCGYVFFPADETGFDLSSDFPAIERWRRRIAGLPGWKGPYDLMPRAWPHAAAPT